MVFGWGKKKTEPQESPRLHDIALSEVPSILDEAITLRAKALIEQTNRCIDRINPEFSELLKTINSLEDDKPKKEDMDKRFFSVLLRSRRQVIHAIRSGARSDFGHVASYEEAAAFGEELGKGLKKIGDVLGKQSKVIHSFTKKYADRMKNILTLLNSDKDKVFEFVQNYEKANSRRLQILENLKQIQEIEELESAKSARISTLSESLDRAEHDADEITEQINLLRSSSQYAQYVKTLEKLKDFEESRAPLKFEIDRQFTKISRPLGKYLHVCSEKEKLPVLRSLVRNPMDVLVPDNKRSVIEILQSVRKASESGSISVKDVAKTSQLLDETTETIAVFIEKITKWEHRRSSIQDELAVFDADKLKQYEAQLSKAQESASDIRSRMEMLQSQISESKAQIPGLVSDIEAGLGEISASRYTIKR